MSKKKYSKKTSFKQDNSHKLISILMMAVGIIGLGAWLLISSIQSDEGNTAIAARESDGVQIIDMSLSTAGYNPANITVKKGIPVKINTNATADAGCVRGMMIPEFNINEALDVGLDSLTFTPSKSGTFDFSCQMRMSRGTITVV